jgi:hypothetical protein
MLYISIINSKKSTKLNYESLYEGFTKLVVRDLFLLQSLKKKLVMLLLANFADFVDSYFVNKISEICQIREN